MQLLDGQQEAPVNTVLLQHPQNFSRGTRQYTFHTFTRSVKDVYTSLACFQDFSKVCWSGNLFCSTTAATKTALGISQLWFSYFRGIMACTLPGRLSTKMRGSWFIHSSLFFCVWSWSICQSFSALPKRHTARHTTIRRSKFPNSSSNYSQLGLISDLAEASESLLMHSSMEFFICAKLKHPAWKILLHSVRWGANVDKRKAACLNFLFSYVGVK